MTSFGKKILSAFVEVTEETEKEKPVTETPTTQVAINRPPVDNGKFRQYFDQLFSEANIPGPDYYEFACMIEAMQGISDEKARYSAAFAGLAVQGLNREQLLSTASEYINVLEKDAANFNATIDAAVQEKVQAKKQEIDEKTKRIQQLSQEITELHNKIAVLSNEIKENEEKIRDSTGGYHSELTHRKEQIQYDIEKIKQHNQ